MSKSLRLVIDTSVFIRYLLRPNAATRRLIEELWLGGKICLICAPELFLELKSVLERHSIRTYIMPEEGNLLLNAVQIFAEFLPPLGEIPTYTRDYKDDKFIACAIIGQVSYVISEDKDLLELHEFAGVKILTPYDFVALEFPN